VEVAEEVPRELDGLGAEHEGLGLLAPGLGQSNELAIGYV
jgi:hypothetical protein